ncbi:hypothetical protein LTR37_000486 [Vermiconidia calcicola]|uniref:Uncharacterized protein n=1 Tax=Vermiconidia calcicola TaxID=1690605 RepID=A0ACC3NZ07_9PEZI|nr:hypothetical protein LTR37_000486 [Vermiconidia calcicola]
MSYSMSPPQKPAPRPYSPYQTAGSPTNPPAYGPPPAKRQRMSPDPRSPPNGAPNYPHQHHGLPTPGGYGNPYEPPGQQSPYTTPSYGNSPNSFNTPQAYQYPNLPWQQQQASTPSPAQGGYGMRQSSPPSHQSREMMPPPPRPNKEEREEKVGVEEIGDSLFGSGINLKDEENYIHSMYNNRHTQNDSFSTNQNSSFGSSTLSPNNSFNLLTQGTSFNSQDGRNGAFAGTMGHTMSQEDIEVEQRRKREAAAKALAERRQHHLNNQFLLCNNVRKRMDRLALNHGVTVNMQGVFVRQPETNVLLNGSKENGIVATEDRVGGMKQDVRPESVVNQNTPFEHVVSLVSLAAGERMRGLLDEAFALARARKYGDHGRVPPEFADVAVGEGKQTEETVVAENLTGSQWDRVPEGAVDGNDGTPQPQHTISFSGSLNARLRDLAERDKQAEADRVKRREARKRAAAANGDTTTTPVDAAAPTADEVPAAAKLTKKELAKQAKEKNNQNESTTNQTAAKFTMGKKASKYSWMTGGVSAMPTNRFAKAGTAAGSGTATPTAKPEPATPGGGTAMVKTGSGMGVEAVKVPEWGDWREERGIQMRDWVLVLERDGREKGALQRALNGLS